MYYIHSTVLNILYIYIYCNYIFVSKVFKICQCGSMWLRYELCFQSSSSYICIANFCSSGFTEWKYSWLKKYSAIYFSISKRLHLYIKQCFSFLYYFIILSRGVAVLQRLLSRSAITHIYKLKKNCTQ